MATQRLLALIGGKLAEYIPLLSSAGAGSSGSVPALDGTGKLDITFMPSGLGADVAIMTASEAIPAGAFVNVWNNAGVPSVRNADGSAGANGGKQADGFVLSAMTSGATGLVYFGGVNTAVTSQTPGVVYLSATTAGGLSPTGAAAAGQTYQEIGMALSATSIQFDRQMPILRA